MLALNWLRSIRAAICIKSVADQFALVYNSDWNVVFGDLDTLKLQLQVPPKNVNLNFLD